MLAIACGPARARLCSLGASLTGFWLEGMDHSLALGSGDPAAYAEQMRHFGAIVGPVANRIAGGMAPLEGRVIELPKNEGENSLHGGPGGLSRSAWDVAERAADSVTFAIHRTDGEGGLPGPVDFTATYVIEPDGALRIDLSAQSALTTLCNPAFHGYWSLNGAGLAGHRLTVHAEGCLPVDDEKIPTGDIAPVEGTAFDLSNPAPLPLSRALDTNFCLKGQGLREVARLETDALVLSLETDAPGLQVYDGANIDTGPAEGHDGTPYGAHAGIALEPQHWPDAPNHPDFPGITLHPGETFRQTSRFRITRKETP